MYDRTISNSIKSFDKELKHREFHSMLLSRTQDFYAEISPQISVIESMNGKEKRGRALKPVVKSVLKRLNVALYNRDASRTKSGAFVYPTCRVFNGLYYESFPMRWLVSFVADWLVDFCKADVDKYKLFDSVVESGIMDYLYDCMLLPRYTLMCFRNGVVDMNDKNMELKPHSPEYDVVKLYNFNWNREAECPTWKTFLGIPQYFSQKGIIGVLPEASKRAVLQKFLGASFIDRSKVRFEYFLILYGDGANGKSVIKDVLEGIFGKDEILPNLDLGQLCRQGDEKLRALDSMDGKRISYCTELNLGALKQPETLKILSSGESTVGRGIGENIRVINDIPLIICNTNRKVNDKDSMPKDSPNDISVSRRLLLISFDKEIREDERNPEIVQQLLKEKEGIFQWIVRGFKRLKKDKYKITESLEGRIDKIRMDLHSNIPIGDGNKRVAGSISEYLKFKGLSPVKDYEHPNEHLIAFSLLYENYRRFCTKNGVSVKMIATDVKFGRDLGVLGYSKRDDMGSTNTTGYLVYSDSEFHISIIQSVPSIIEQLNIDALLSESKAEEDEFDEQL